MTLCFEFSCLPLKRGIVFILHNILNILFVRIVNSYLCGGGHLSGLVSHRMQYIRVTLLLCCVGFIPSVGHTEIWSYACAEAMTLLAEAQQDVAENHQRVYQSKLALRLFPDGLETCRTNRRGFAGGTIHCVNHRSHGGVAIKEVIKAERELVLATQKFEGRLTDLQQACSALK
ncbi:MAG: hypothetical protein ACPGYT_06680 [Nitrospirales bacterium]